MPGLVRTFVAVPVEKPDVLEALRRAQDELRHVGGITWVRPGCFHFTLRFLGEIEEERVAAAKRAVESVGGSGAFDLTLQGVGTFPPGRPARVVWAGCGEGGDALVSLALRAEAAIVASGFPREERPFSPHLTLGRVKDPHAGKRVARSMGEMAEAGDWRFGTLRVGAVVLMKSVLSSEGPTYTAMAVVKL